MRHTMIDTFKENAYAGAKYAAPTLLIAQSELATVPAALCTGMVDVLTVGGQRALIVPPVLTDYAQFSVLRRRRGKRPYGSCTWSEHQNYGTK